jgi:hypothetical protein
MSEEEDEVINASQGRVSILRSLTPSSQSRGHSLTLRIEN